MISIFILKIFLIGKNFFIIIGRLSNEKEDAMSEQNAHDKFIAAGSKLYPELGYYKLSVRVLAAEAGLSSGMFHHLFANKDAFILELLNHHNNYISANLDMAALSDNLFEKLRTMAQVLAEDIRNNLQLIHRMFADSANGVDVINHFIRTTSAKRMELFRKVLEECGKLDNSVPATDVQRLGYFSAAVNAPMIIGSRFGQMDLLPDTIKDQVPDILTNEAISERIDWCLNAMFPYHAKFTDKQEKS